jgi:hypothetical protein
MISDKMPEICVISEIRVKIMTGKKPDSPRIHPRPATKTVHSGLIGKAIGHRHGFQIGRGTPAGSGVPRPNF